jgi:hypothetical protein
MLKKSNKKQNNKEPPNSRIFLFRRVLLRFLTVRRRKRRPSLHGRIHGVSGNGVVLFEIEKYSTELSENTQKTHIKKWLMSANPKEYPYVFFQK